MINARLLGLVGNSKRFLFLGVLSSWLSLLFQIFATFAMSELLESVRHPERDPALLFKCVGVVCLAILVRMVCDMSGSYLSHLSSRSAKRSLRRLIYEKLLRFGISHHKKWRPPKLCNSRLKVSSSSKSISADTFRISFIR
jgi:ATP-binding cassette subfamily C protein